MSHYLQATANTLP